MKLKEVDIAERNFLILAESIDREFGGEIPWLKDFSELRLSMNVDHFRNGFIDCVRGFTEPENIVAYALATSDLSETFLGGMLHLPVSPEEFESDELRRIAAELTTNRYSYITCLHMRDVVRGKGHGAALFSEAMTRILSRHPKVWGVVSKEELLPWYEHFGGTTVAHMSGNEDGLALITYDDKTFRKRTF